VKIKNREAISKNYVPKALPSSITRKDNDLSTIRMKLRGITKFQYVTDTISEIAKETTEVVFLTSRLLNSIAPK